MRVSRYLSAMLGGLLWASTNLKGLGDGGQQHSSKLTSSAAGMLKCIWVHACKDVLEHCSRWCRCLPARQEQPAGTDRKRLLNGTCPAVLALLKLGGIVALVELLGHLVIDPVESHHTILNCQLLLCDTNLAQLLQGCLITRILWCPAVTCMSPHLDCVLMSMPTGTEASLIF